MIAMLVMLLAGFSAVTALILWVDHWVETHWDEEEE